MKDSLQKGFTLIELLVVIAVIGVLATIVLAAINPIEQLARGRDAGRINIVDTMGHAMGGFVASQASNYPAFSVTWQQALVDAKEISSLQSADKTNAGPCTVNAQNNICYDVTNDDEKYVLNNKIRY